MLTSRLITRAALLIALITALGVQSPRPAAAQSGIIYVRAGATAPGTGTSWANAYPSLQSALLAAASSAEIWVAAGRYTPAAANGSRSATFQLKSGVAIYGGFAGTETQRVQRNRAANLVTLSGDLNGNDGPDFVNYSENSLHVVTGATGATLDGVTISGGNADNEHPDNHGGGMFNINNSNLVLTNVTISGNRASIGGGMHNDNSSPTLTNVTISGNSAPNNGGGIYNYKSNPTLTNVTISGNRAGTGGGMLNVSSSPTMTHVTISGNSALEGGGGMFNFGSSPTLTNVTISGNSTAMRGGGMYNYAISNPVLTNVTISGNRADTGGGGMYNADNSNPTLTNVTISGNAVTVGTGGGLSNWKNSNPQVRNSIVWGNTAPNGSAIFNDASTPAISYSLIEGGYAGTGNLSTDPIFVTPIDSATAPTTTGNLRLRAGSPALDAGNAAVASPVLPASDHDGQARVIDLPSVGNGAGGAVDMGAYERQASGVRYVDVAATGSGSGYTWADAMPSLQVALAIAGSGDELWVAKGVYRPNAGISPAPTDPRTATFQLVSGVAIFGGFGGTETARTQRNGAANIVTLSGDLGGNDGANFANNGENSIHVVTGATGATLDSVTISAGNANVNAPGMNAGGGMANFSSSPVLASVIISANTAVAGGGMYNEDSNPTLRNVTFSGNRATDDYGGAMYNLSSSPTLTNVTISGNSATSGGGGMFNLGSSPTLTNVTISGNIAASGGGMFNQDSNPTLTNAVVSSNTAAAGGGGMFNLGSSPTLTNVTISGNSAASGGGMFNQDSNLTLTNAVVSDNTVAAGGGGLFNLVSSPTLTNVTISGNSAETGGGVFNQDSNPALTNVVVSGNYVTDSGGGMYNTSSSPILTNVTINGNSADNSGGGVFNEVNSNPQIRNSIVWSNGNTAIVNNASTPAISYSLIEGGYTGTGNLGTDPQFVTPISPASAPTTAGDLRLRAGSPAIDAGNDVIVAAVTDRDGNPRRMDGNSNGTVRVDMGAYERQGNPFNRVLLPLVRR